MSYPETVLALPPVYGDNAAEIDTEIIRRGRAFYGSDDKLALPAEYVAKAAPRPRFRVGNQPRKLYVVEGLIVRRHHCGAGNTVHRTVVLPAFSRGSATEIENEVKRLVIEFFGSEDGLDPTTKRLTIQDLPDVKGDPQYQVDCVTILQVGRWPEA